MKVLSQGMKVLEHLQSMIDVKITLSLNNYNVGTSVLQSITLTEPQIENETISYLIEYLEDQSKKDITELFIEWRSIDAKVKQKQKLEEENKLSQYNFYQIIQMKCRLRCTFSLDDIPKRFDDIRKKLNDENEKKRSM